MYNRKDKTMTSYRNTRSIAKAFLGSAKTRRAILTERPTSFWAWWLRDEVKSFLRSEAKSFLGCKAKSFLRFEE